VSHAARRKPVSARTAAEGALAVIACSAALGATAGCVLVYAARAAARRAWTWAKRRLRAAVMQQAARDAGLCPALAARDGEPAAGQTIYDDGNPFERAAEPRTPPPGWTCTDTPSPAELYDDALLRRPR
jgi:hypothetical protein